MIIKTEFGLKDKCFFLMCDKIHEALIERLEVSIVQGQSSITYTIDNNSAGTQYRKRFLESELFETKQDLLESL